MLLHIHIHMYVLIVLSTRLSCFHHADPCVFTSRVLLQVLDPPQANPHSIVLRMYVHYIDVLCILCIRSYTSCAEPDPVLDVKFKPAGMLGGEWHFVKHQSRSVLIQSNCQRLFKKLKKNIK